MHCRPPSPAPPEAVNTQPAQAPAAVYVTAAAQPPQQATLPPPPAVSGGHSAVKAAAVPRADIQLSPTTASLLSQVTQPRADARSAV